MKTKILIVDDQNGILMLLEEVFKKEGFETYLASRGMEALQIIDQIQIDVVLLDLKLPLMDGKEVLKLIRVKLPSVPVVIMSAYQETVITNELLENGASKFISKPFNIADIKEVVNGVLEK
jgi:two-component system response regulator (stage 0 sporulation protein F)